MKKKIGYVGIVTALFCLPLWAGAQIKLTGNVKNEKEPIGWANVVLTDLQGKLATGASTKPDGSFELNAKGGSYTLAITSLGFTSWTQQIVLARDTDLGVVSLKAGTKSLAEVTITAKTPLVQYKADRLVFDVQHSIAATGGDAVNAISSAPGIIVQNNTISMLGKGASRVMVDGRIIELSGDELMNFLKSIPAGDIKNIEIITNPPAKYEAAGNGGLININLKKGRADSWKNSTVLAYDQNTYGSATLNDNFLYNKDKVKFSLSAGGKVGDSKVEENLNTYYPTGPWNLTYNGKQKENNLSGRMALDYDLSAKTTIGFQYLGNYNTPNSLDNTLIRVNNTGGNLDSLLVNKGQRILSSGSQSYNAHIVSSLDTLKRKLSFDLDYFTYNSKTDNNFAATTFAPDGTFLDINQSARNISNQNIQNYSAKADMEHPLKFVNLSYGAKVSFINSTADIQYFNTISGSPKLDPGQSNTFDYKENNQAVYINGAKTISTKFSMDLGFRLENTQTNGYSATLDQTTLTNYLNLFPSFDMSYKANDSSSFFFDYGRRINRPGFALLNPFRSYINSNSYSEGNPFLQPSFSDNFDLSHVYKNLLRTEVFLNITNDGYGTVFTSDPTNNTLVITRQNYYKEYYYGAGETITADITSWWQSQNSVYLLGSKSKFTNGINAAPGDSPEFYFSTNNSFSLSKLTQFEVDYQYNTGYKRGLYQFGYTSGLNIGFKQSLVKDKLQLSLFANDVFNTAYLKNYTSVVNGIKQVYSENNSSRFFRISLTYNFGNSIAKMNQRDFGNDEERKRTN
ncbi:TonB-dependent receptor domain-containing protein [Mucilaginibacter sp. X4EP1]|uniref:outer membrane beta-barrel family protein n=1 Tax=Mucilaginibacter sp. X4EP1 TaxID=2723092 RepID=UPI0021681721|nr:outer membrane beta-barrel family protein [Mucilaginibacter sp. X4EP1]MCS3813423.1 outer membrane receptor protein involved in Fe transport [Mucilaginibacter sp. X4EP1]